MQGIDFELYKGETVALMGFNGAGKSTLINLLGGLAELSSGELDLLGGTVGERAYEIGYLRQEPDLMLLADSVWEELTWKIKKLGKRLYGSFLKN